MLFSENQQFFVVILSGARRVDAHPDMFETHIVFQKGFYLPGIDKTGKVIVHVKCYTVDFRVCPHTRFAGQKNNLYNGKG